MSEKTIDPNHENADAWRKGNAEETRRRERTQEDMGRPMPSPYRKPDPQEGAPR